MTSWDSSAREHTRRGPYLVFNSDGDLVFDSDGGLPEVDDKPHDCQHQRWFCWGVLSIVATQVVAAALVWGLT